MQTSFLIRSAVGEGLPSASWTCGVLVLGVVLLLSFTAKADQAREYEFDIPQQGIETALSTLATQAGALLLFPYDLVQPVDSKPVSGRYTVEDALAILLEGTGLTGGLTEGGVITISRAGAIDNQGRTIMAQNHDDLDGNKAPTKRRGLLGMLAVVFSAGVGAQDVADVDEEELRIEEIVVTGTNIRGSAPIGSPINVIDRTEIDRSGLGTVQQLVQSLPQNFRGDASEDIVSTDSGGTNLSGGTGVNLRGLGSSATLVLVNGRRSTQGGGSDATFVDVSNLPLSVIDRVEILTDGASSIYGSDAIAGVVNFVLRDDYDGAETRIRYGDSSQGGAEEFQVSQTFSKTWGGGNILVSYEYFNRGRLESEQRPFAATSDLTALGGDDFRQAVSNPGNIVSPTQAAIPLGQDGTSLDSSDLLTGVTNLQNSNRGVDLFNDQERHSVFLTANQTVSEFAEVFGEFRFSQREFDRRGGGNVIVNQAVTDAHPFFVSPDPTGTSIHVNYNTIEDFGPAINSGDVTTYGGGLGTSFGLWSNWEAELFGLYSGEYTDRRSDRVNRANLIEALGVDDPSTAFDPTVDGFFNVFSDGSNTPQNVLDFVGNGFREQSVDSDLWSLNLRADGDLFSLPGGTVKLATGMEYREESLDTTAQSLVGAEIVVSDGEALSQSRNVVAVFGEVLIPLIGEANSTHGIRNLDVSVSARFEDYSDFGSTTNPKVGVAWSPVEGLNFRGTYGTSFKVPNLTQLNPVGIVSIAFNAPDPNAADGRTVGLFLQGPNPSLDAETSTSWTVGADFTPESVPELTVGVTYFDIDFEGRIGRLPGNLFAAFSNQDVFAPVTAFDPDDTIVQSFLVEPVEFQDFFGLTDASEIEAIVDGRINNLATTNVSGLDFNASYSFGTEYGDFEFGVNGNYLFEFKEATSVIAPAIDVVDTINNPIDLNLRGSVSWTNGPLSVTTFINYADSYQDNLSAPERKIDSWTTIDLYVNYQLDEVLTGDLLDGLDLSVSVQNLFDQDPPFANNGIIGISGVGYDRENASPLGRFIAVQVTKQW